jgi:hypothetical protein
MSPMILYTVSVGAFHTHSRFPTLWLLLEATEVKMAWVSGCRSPGSTNLVFVNLKIGDKIYLLLAHFVHSFPVANVTTTGHNLSWLTTVWTFAVLHHPSVPGVLHYSVKLRTRSGVVQQSDVYYPRPRLAWMSYLSVHRVCTGRNWPKMTPLNFRPANPEISTVNPQRFFYGLISLAGFTGFIRRSLKSLEFQKSHFKTLKSLEIRQS